jgi:uncharacterized membrane protein YfcA
MLSYISYLSDRHSGEDGPVHKLLTLALVGLAAQLVDGTLGMAYGVTSTTLLLAAGYGPAVASASVHLAEIGTTLASGTAHWRFGNVDWRVVTRIGVPGAVGAFVGASLLSSLSTESATPWTAGILLALGLYVLLRFAGRSPRVRPGGAPGRRFLTPLGLFAGFIDSTGGGGWGPVATPTLLSTGRMEPRKVIGTVDTSEFLVAVAASIGFLIGLGGAGIAWTPVLGLLAGGLVAAPVAAYLVRIVPARLLGSSVGGLIIVTNLRTLMSVLEIDGAGRLYGYVGAYGVWALAVAASVVGLRRDRRRERAAEGAPEDVAVA